MSLCLGMSTKVCTKMLRIVGIALQGRRASLCVDYVSEQLAGAHQDSGAAGLCRPVPGGMHPSHSCRMADTKHASCGHADLFLFRGYLEEMFMFTHKEIGYGRLSVYVMCLRCKVDGVNRTKTNAVAFRGQGEKNFLRPHVARPLSPKELILNMHMQGKEKTEPEKAGQHASSSQLRQVLINRCESMSPRVCLGDGFFVECMWMGASVSLPPSFVFIAGVSTFFRGVYVVVICMNSHAPLVDCAMKCGCALRVCESATHACLPGGSRANVRVVSTFLVSWPGNCMHNKCAGSYLTGRFATTMARGLIVIRWTYSLRCRLQK